MSFKLVVVSDTHGNRDACDIIKKRIPDAEYYIHCGDVGFPDLIGWIVVKGNVDDQYDYPEEKKLVIEDQKILIVHGNRYFNSAMPDYSALIQAAKKVSVMLFYLGTVIFDFAKQSGMFTDQSMRDYKFERHFRCFHRCFTCITRRC